MGKHLTLPLPPSSRGPPSLPFNVSPLFHPTSSPTTFTRLTSVPPFFICQISSLAREHSSQRSMRTSPTQWGVDDGKLSSNRVCMARPVDLLTRCLSKTQWELEGKCTVEKECKWKRRSRCVLRQQMTGRKYLKVFLGPKPRTREKKYIESTPGSAFPFLLPC